MIAICYSCIDRGCCVVIVTGQLPLSLTYDTEDGDTELRLRERRAPSCSGPWCHTVTPPSSSTHCIVSESRAHCHQIVEAMMEATASLVCTTGLCIWFGHHSLCTIIDKIGIQHRKCLSSLNEIERNRLTDQHGHQLYDIMYLAALCFFSCSSQILAENCF